MITMNISVGKTSAYMRTDGDIDLLVQDAIHSFATGRLDGIRPCIEGHSSRHE